MCSRDSEGPWLVKPVGSPVCAIALVTWKTRGTGRRQEPIQLRQRCGPDMAAAQASERWHSR